MPVWLMPFRTVLDVHRSTAAEVFDVPLGKSLPQQRYRAKAINFGLIYGNEYVRFGSPITNSS